MASPTTTSRTRDGARKSEGSYGTANDKSIFFARSSSTACGDVKLSGRVVNEKTAIVTRLTVHSFLRLILVHG